MLKGKVTMKGFVFPEAAIRIAQLAGGTSGWNVEAAVFHNVELSKEVAVEIIERAPAMQEIDGVAKMVMSEQKRIEKRKPEPFFTFRFSVPYKDGENPWDTAYAGLQGVLESQFSGTDIERVSGSAPQ